MEELTFLKQEVVNRFSGLPFGSSMPAQPIWPAQWRHLAPRMDKSAHRKRWKAPKSRQAVSIARMSGARNHR
jgi:hypothetical protein